MLMRGDAHGGVLGMVGHAADVAMSATDTLELWHRCYGHLGCDTLSELLRPRRSGLTGMTLTAADSKAATAKPCGFCASPSPNSTIVNGSRLLDKAQHLTHIELGSYVVQIQVVGGRGCMHSSLHQAHLCLAERDSVGAFLRQEA